MSYYLLKPCRTATAFISTLKKPQRIDLGAAARKIRGAGLPVTDVKVMLIVESSPEVTLYESGKILVKADTDADARGAIDRIYRILGLAEPPRVPA